MPRGCRHSRGIIASGQLVYRSIRDVFEPKMHLESRWKHRVRLQAEVRCSWFASPAGPALMRAWAAGGASLGPIVQPHRPPMARAGSVDAENDPARRYARARGHQHVLDARYLIGRAAADLADAFGDSVHAVDIGLAELTTMGVER